jgi:hypothetical protein
MIAKTPKRRKASNPPASALARWENEGGASGPASGLSRDKAVFSEQEGHILQCLGAAVLLQWNDLPAPIQRQLFEHAVAMGEAGQTAQLKEQIARFLHKHKDDEREAERGVAGVPAKLQQAGSGGPWQLYGLPPVIEDRCRSCQ